LRAAPVGAARDRNDVSSPYRPLALHTKQLRPQIEDQVVALVIEGAGYAHSELHAFVEDRSFRDQAKLIRRQHRQQPTRRTGRIVAAKGNVSV
jgi:hypothetical protein